MSGGKTRTAKVLKAIEAVKRSDMPAEEKACAVLTMTRFLERRRKENDGNKNVL